MEVAAEPWTAITRRDKDCRLAHRRKVAREYIMAAHTAKDSPTKPTEFRETRRKAPRPTHSAKAHEEPAKRTSYAAVASGVSHNGVAATTGCPAAEWPALSTTSAGVTPDAAAKPVVCPSSTEATASVQDTFSSAGSSSTNDFKINHTHNDLNNTHGTHSLGDSKVDIDPTSNAITTCFAMGRTTLSHLMAREVSIGEQLNLAGLQGNFEVRINSSQCEFDIITDDDLSEKDESVVNAFIDEAKHEVLAKQHKMNYAGRGSGQFVIFQNGCEARNVTNYDDDRGVLVFAEDGFSDRILQSLKTVGEIIFSEKVVLNDNTKDDCGVVHGACGSGLAKSKAKKLCGKVVFKTIDHAKEAVGQYGSGQIYNSSVQFFVKAMGNSDQSRIDEGSTLTFTADFPPPVEEVHLFSDRIPYGDKLSNLRTAANSPGTNIGDCLCPWHWEFRHNIEVRVDVRKLVEKRAWSESRVKSQVRRFVSQSTGLRFSEDVDVVRGATPEVNRALIRESKWFVENVVEEFVRSGTCTVYLSPLTTDREMIIEAVFKNPEQAKSVALVTLPENIAIMNDTSQAPRFKAFPYFCRKQLTPRMYQVMREGIDVLRESVKDKYKSAVRIETAMRKNGGAIVFVRATRRDIGWKVGSVLNNILSYAEVTIPSDLLCSMHLFGTFSCRRWIKFLENKYKVFIYVDEFRRSMHIHGPPEIKARVKREIEEWCKTKLRHSSVINIEEHRNFWPNIIDKYRLRLGRLATDCGAEHVLLNFKSKSLIVVGPKSCVTKLNQILSSSPSDSGCADVSKDECVACFCDAGESCLRLSLCGHAYCLSCFYISFFVSAESGQFPLRCASCDDPILMEDVQSVLREDYADLQWFINRSVTSMVARHSDEYNHCSSPDCNLVYTCTPPGADTKFDCPACGVVTCRSCRVPYHEGEACWLYRLRNSKNDYEQAMLTWMTEDQKNRGVCPRCGHGIEKDGGCNKLHCSRCNANICWLCMKDFPSSTEAYDHLDKVHGGYM